MVTCTASIGLAVLKSAIGLRKNYKTTVTDEFVDLKATGCQNCACFLQSDAKHCDNSEFPFCSKCDNCLYKIISTNTRTVYINEKNKYGYRPELKKNALLLFMYLHYLNPDKNGLVYVNIEDAATTLKCTERTVRNNLRLLDKYFYIDLNADPKYPGYYQLFLKEYPTYFKQADQGGRGYCVLPLDHLKTLVSMTNINRLRLAIRSLIPDTLFSSKEERRTELAYLEVQRDLPSYCSKNKIKELVASEEFTRMFHVIPKKYFITIKAKEEFNIENVSIEYKNDCRNRIIQLMDKFKAESKKLKINFDLLEDDINDICNIALKIPVQNVTKAFEQMYERFVKMNIPVHNVGGLVRSLAMEL